MKGVAKIAGLALVGALLASGAGADRTGETAKAEEPLLREELGCLDPGRDPEEATVHAMRVLGTAFLSWVSDTCEAAPADEAKRLGAEAMAVWNGLEPEPRGVSTWGRYPHPKLSVERLDEILGRHEGGGLFYLLEIPALDGWCRPLEIVGSPDNPFGPTVFALRSAGANGVFEGPRYQVGAFEPGDKIDDIVWEDGFFIRWPEKTGSSGFAEPERAETP